MIAKVTILFAFLCFSILNCSTSRSTAESPASLIDQDALLTGAERTQAYFPNLQHAGGVALVVNQTSRIGSVHLVDSLLSAGVPVKRIFAPEHGFRGQADAGASVEDGRDRRTGLPIFSLYGRHKKPSAEQLSGIDIVVFDVQDVGARFYTYISTMHYVMEACAENDVFFMVLDRPNPNGHYVDGPVLDTAYRSFVGMHPVPVVHGMTVGEYARMINGEGWLSIPAEMKVIPCQGYTHQTPYKLPVRPSPNLPNMRAIYLYPSLCFFEGTAVSVGRGTKRQFQVYGHPQARVGDYYFTPVSMAGARYPKHEGVRCRGYALFSVEPDAVRQIGRLQLDYLLSFYEAFPNKDAFFLDNGFFDKLAGTDRLRHQIRAGASAEAIRQSWAADLAAFRELRKPYLLYPD